MNCFGNTNKIAIVSGFGESEISKLNAFDNALINAKIHDLNLIKVSSILSKNTKIVKKFEIEKGSFCPCVLSIAHGEKNEEICSGIGIGFNNEKYGYVMEAQEESQAHTILKLEKNLCEMAQNRNQKIITKKIIIKSGKSTKKFSCAVTAVIYLF